MRQLWTKQMLVLATQGDGVALKAFNIRITYVNLIQVSNSMALGELTVWTYSLTASSDG